jgi:hypothetical protein
MAAVLWRGPPRSYRHSALLTPVVIQYLIKELTIVLADQARRERDLHCGAPCHERVSDATKHEKLSIFYETSPVLESDGPPSDGRYMLGHTTTDDA